MKFTKSIAVLCFVFLHFGCSESDGPEEEVTEGEGTEEPVEEPVPAVFFTLNIEEGWRDTAERDDWLIIHDENGEIMGYQPFESDETLEFEALESEVTDRLTLTLFSFSQDSSKNKFHDFLTYAEIEKGSTWKLKAFVPGPEREPAIGKFDVSVTNFNGLLNAFSYGLSNSNGRGFISGSSQSMDGRTLTFPFLELYEENDYLLSLYDANGRPKYLFIDDVQNGDDLRLDFQDFNFFDSALRIDLHPPYYSCLGRVFAFEDNGEGFKRSYRTNRIRYFSGGSQEGNFDTLELGFLDRYTNYGVTFSINKEAYNYQKVSYGPKPENITLPEDHSLMINNASLWDFDFTTNFEFIRKANYWIVGEGELNIDLATTRWTVLSSNSGFPKIHAIPQELKELYPNLDTDNLHYNSSTFYIQAESHQEYMNVKHKDGEFVPFMDSERIQFIQREESE